MEEVIIAAQTAAVLAFSISEGTTTNVPSGDSEQSSMNDHDFGRDYQAEENEEEWPPLEDAADVTRAAALV